MGKNRKKKGYGRGEERSNGKGNGGVNKQGKRDNVEMIRECEGKRVKGDDTVVNFFISTVAHALLCSSLAHVFFYFTSVFLVWKNRGNGTPYSFPSFYSFPHDSALSDRSLFQPFFPPLYSLAL